MAEEVRTTRLVLRPASAEDRPRFLDLLASADVGTYLGGARPRDELESTVPEVPGQRPGFFVVDLDGSLIGTVTLDRDAAGRTEIGYLFLPEAWGHGYATEACLAALAWCAATRPGEPVLLTTQTANEPSMRLAARLGFTEVERFEAYGAEQWRGRWSAGGGPG